VKKQARPFRMGVIGTGWIGRRRAEVCAGHPLISELHLADVVPDVVQSAAAGTGATSWTTDYRELLDRVDAVIVSTAPETTHYPIARDALAAGKHTLPLPSAKPMICWPAPALPAPALPSATRSDSIRDSRT